jgi:TPR repeat protein
MRELAEIVAGLVAVCLLVPLWGFGEDVEEVRKRAEAGQAIAQLDLGWIYQNGDGVPQDDAEAVKWYRKAAEQGLATAQSNLGMMLIEGRGVPQDRVEALKWFREAARQGHLVAYYNLGMAYSNGDGVPRDNAEAMKWLLKAARGKDTRPQPEGVDFYQSGDYAPWPLSLRSGIIEKGLPAAQYHLGFMYGRGVGVEVDHTEASKWYRKAAEQGYAKAQSNLANMYRTGQGVPQDISKALDWYRRAAGQGDTMAMNHLGTIYALGTGVPKDLAQACQWFTLSAAAGNETGMKNSDYLMQRLSPEQIAECRQLVREWKEVYRDRGKEEVKTGHPDG